MPQMNLRTSTLYIGGIEVEIGDGNLTYTESRPLEYLTSGNEITEVREADEEPLDVKMDFIWKRVHGDYAALIATIDGTGKTSSDPIACRPYAVNLDLKYPITCGATPTYKYVQFANFRYETLDHDLKAGTISVSGKCNIQRAAIASLPLGA